MTAFESLLPRDAGGANVASATAEASGSPGAVVETVEETSVTATSSSAHSSSSVQLGGSSDPDAAEGGPGSAPTPSLDDDSFVFRLEGGPGDDVFTVSGPGDRWIDGGDGFDVVIYDGPRDAYERDRAEDGGFGLVRPDGSADSLSDIERIDFDDGSYLLDLAGENAEFAFRLYATAFGRVADEAGLRYWTGMLDEGLSRDALADAFAASPEFAALAGPGADDAAFVAGLYDRVLIREADAAGLEFWVSLLESDALDRGDILEHFADSPEMMDLVASDLEDGILVL